MPRVKPFWTLDSETDPFEEVATSIARRGCPACGVAAGIACKALAGGTHSERRRVSQPFIWGLYGGPHGDDYHEFATVDQVITFLEREPHIVYAHNGGKFDYHYLREYINTGEALSIIAGRLSRFKIGVCEFRDSMNILPVSLATFKKEEIDYSIFEADQRDIPTNREAIRKYLRSDCVYLHELITAHRKENGVTLTQAGASMRAWSKQSGIKPPRQSSAAYQLYKPFYYGGRVQCFTEGTKQLVFKLLDINSAYPEAMLHPHPFSPVGNFQSHLPRDSDLHKCLITLTCVARGCFPFRNDKFELFFPHDEQTIRRYHVTGYEFISALKLNAARSITIEAVHIFEQTVKFEEFILGNWDRRAAAKREGNKALDIIIKLLMNSLYGKFASDYNKYFDYMLCHTDDLLNYEKLGYKKDTDWEHERKLICRPIPEEKHRFYNIATAASITGFVRAKLFEAISRCETPLYCDTDSIACIGAGDISIGDGLGAWKEEGTFDRFSIVGKKTYSFHKQGLPDSIELDAKGDYANYKVACKGVDLSPVEIDTAARGVTVVYSPTVPTYSVKREAPIFTDRKVRVTARDIRIVPEDA